MPPAQGGRKNLGACAKARGWLPMAPASSRPGTLDDSGRGNCLLGRSDHMANQCEKGKVVSQLQSPSHSPLFDPLGWCSTVACEKMTMVTVSRWHQLEFSRNVNNSGIECFSPIDSLHCTCAVLVHCCVSECLCGRPFLSCVRHVLSKFFEPV